MDSRSIPALLVSQLWASNAGSTAWAGAQFREEVGYVLKGHESIVLTPIRREVAGKPGRYTGTVVDAPTYLDALDGWISRIRAVREGDRGACTRGLLAIYWEIGGQLDEWERLGRGEELPERVSVDLRAAFPDMPGLSHRNLQYARALYGVHGGGEVPSGLARIPWRHEAFLFPRHRLTR